MDRQPAAPEATARHVGLILARIQGHPRRAHLHDPLAAALGVKCETWEHDSQPPNPWAGYKLILEGRTVPYDHLLVVQDDAVPAPGFPRAIEKVAARNQDRVVVLFLARLPGRVSRLALRAAKNRQCYLDAELRINEFLPAVGVLWPKPKVEEFLWWVHHNPKRLGHSEPRSDDGVIGRWAALTHQRIRFTIPSLIQHPDMEPSLIGRQPAWGKDTGRIAQLFAEDASKYEW